MAAPRSESSTDAKFVMDYSLNRIAKQLRLLGFDAVCDRGVPSPQLIARAHRERRTFIAASAKSLPQLMRLKRLAAAPRERLVIGYDSDGASEYDDDDDGAAAGAGALLSSVHTGGGGGGAQTGTAPDYIIVDTTMEFRQQMMHLLKSAGVTWCPKKVFSRCVACNRVIQPVADKEAVRALVNPVVFDVYAHFYQCPACEKVFWGVDAGVLVNFKALRTIEYLKTYCLPAAAAAGAAAAADWRATGLRRHMLSYPRVVKCAILVFLPVADLDNFGAAYPMLGELVAVIRRGGTHKFVRYYKKGSLVVPRDGVELPPEHVRSTSSYGGVR
jgi:uncharacterized protein with PIN domain